MRLEVGCEFAKVVENEWGRLLAGAGICPASPDCRASAVELERVAAAGFSVVALLVPNACGFVQGASDLGGGVDAGDRVEVVDGSFVGGFVDGDDERVMELKLGCGGTGLEIGGGLGAGVTKGCDGRSPGALDLGEEGRVSADVRGSGGELW